MNQVTLRNYRCFREEQTARLAPLTLLVGDNSTGKTSFLAMVRALWEAVYQHRVPDFKKTPYDLGGFGEIAHRRGGRFGPADNFGASFRAAFGRPTKRPRAGQGWFEFGIEFAKQGATPVPIRRFIGDDVIAIHDDFGEFWRCRVSTREGEWEPKDNAKWSLRDHGLTNVLPLWSFRFWPMQHEFLPKKLLPIGDSGPFTESLHAKLADFVRDLNWEEERLRYWSLFASAPVRSKPGRNYDLSRPAPDPEGDYIPTYLANIFSQDREAWEPLKDRLEDFGRSAGLFDEISIKTLGKGDAGPFQVQLRKFGGRLKGPPHNMIDMGYGVNQVLPVVTELLRKDARRIYLLQQPEIHLHPSAQAALGTLFCQSASRDRQLIVETHSDHLLDRVRMDVRDGRVRLEPDDVSILFFERPGLNVRIHSLRLDALGNVLGAPDSYRRFFMEETRRSIGL